MNDELRLNTKLIGFDGIMGRWDFCLNFVYLCMIGTLFSIPASGYLMSHIGNFSEIFSMHVIFWEAPWLLKLWVLPGTAFVLYIGVSLIIRRLNDINGRVCRDANTIVSVLYALSTFGLLFPVGISFLLYLVNLVILLYMIIAKGKITGKYPYDYRKEFNWGAFFGTWIWGLFNKSYKTLWMLILWLTPWGFWYALVCGFKGNEWAAKNRDWQNLEEFKKSQETQTIVFVILSVLIIPIIYFLIVMAIVGTIIFTAVDEAKTSPEHKSNTMEKLESAIDSLGSLYFENYEITPDVNKFYVLNDDWRGYSFSEKKDILDMAATMSASKREKLSDKNEHFSKSEELKRTKIYSSETGELLGEFKLDQEVYSSENSDWKSIIKASMNAYQFYTPTKN